MDFEIPGPSSDLFSDYQYKEVVVNEQKYLIGVCKKENDSWHVILTNLYDFFEETLDANLILERCEDMNPSIKITTYVKQFVDQMLTDIPKYQTFITTDKIHLQKELEGGDLLFGINLLPSRSKNFYEKQIDCIISAFFELNQRYNILLDLIKKKDLEIEEYKAQNVPLIKKRYQTQPFTDDVFQKKNNDQSYDKVSSFLTLMEFYKSIKKENARVGIKREVDADMKIDNTDETISNEPVKTKSTTKRSSSDRAAVAADYSLNLQKNKKHFSDF